MSPSLFWIIELNSSLCTFAKLTPSIITSIIRGLSGFFVITRQSIFISGFSSAPLSADLDFISQDYQDKIQNAINVLSKFFSIKYNFINFKVINLHPSKKSYIFSRKPVNYDNSRKSYIFRHPANFKITRNTSKIHKISQHFRIL